MLDHGLEGGNYSGVDRRRRGQAGQSPSEALTQMPALRVLEQIPDAVLGIARDGKVMFANNAFCDMLGYTQEAMLTLDIHQISYLDAKAHSHSCGQMPTSGCSSCTGMALS